MQRAASCRRSGGSVLTLRRDENAAGLREGGAVASSKNLAWSPIASDSQRIRTVQNMGTQPSLSPSGFDSAPNPNIVPYESNESSLEPFDYDDKVAEGIFDKLRQEGNQSELLLENSRNQNAELRNKAAALSQSIRSHRGQVSRLDGIYRQADDCFFSVEAEIVVARKVQEEMLSGLERLQIQTENGMAEATQTARFVNKTRESNDRLQRALEEVERSYDSTMSSAEQEAKIVSEMALELSTAKDRLALMQAGRDTLNEQYMAYEQSSLSIHQDASALKTEDSLRAREIESIKTQLARLTDEYAEEENVRKNLSAQHSSVMKMTSGIAESLEVLEDKIGELEAGIACADKQTHDIRDQQKSLESGAEDMRDAVKTAEQQVQQGRTDLERIEIETKAMSDTLRDKEADLQRLHQQEADSIEERFQREHRSLCSTIEIVESKLTALAKDSQCKKQRVLEQGEDLKRDASSLQELKLRSLAAERVRAELSVLQRRAEELIEERSKVEGSSTVPIRELCLRVDQAQKEIQEERERNAQSRNELDELKKKMTSMHSRSSAGIDRTTAFHKTERSSPPRGRTVALARKNKQRNTKPVQRRPATKGPEPHRALSRGLASNTAPKRKQVERVPKKGRKSRTTESSQSQGKVRDDMWFEDDF
ncbi:hypothetical protein NDN08_005265 [Rhodosorus marinus]|uniref:Uncharacterized protein n=1 Tax=Rhodosorus marinus TaxID=101924 RepID=A0AAV8V229_9RHOD|nr:hypothetical protein NDN08_005265 [Rhodosorus marinus]